MEVAKAQLLVSIKVLGEIKSGKAAPQPAGVRAHGVIQGLKAVPMPAGGRQDLAPSPNPRGLGPGADGQVLAFSPSLRWLLFTDINQT